MPTFLYRLGAMSSVIKKRISRKDLEVLRQIRNTLIHTGKSPSIRDIQTSMGYKSPRSITVILKRLMDKGALERRSDSQLSILHELEEQSYNASTINVPLVGSAACGAPLLAEEYIQAMLPVSIQLAKPPHKYFLLRASGDSMNLVGIEDGDLILVRQQITADDGDIVVALIDSEVTIKKLRQQKNVIILEPCSTSKNYLPIILQKDFSVQGIVIESLGKLTH